YGGLMRLGIPADAMPESEPVPTEPRELPLVRKALEAIDQGGFLEAIARVVALMASQRGEFPLSRLELKSDLQQSDAVLSKLTEDEARRIRAEQSTLVEIGAGTGAGGVARAPRRLHGSRARDRPDGESRRDG